MTRPPRPALPLLNGVSASCVATPPAPRGGPLPWVRLLDFLAQRFPKISRSAWGGRMARGEVLDEQLTIACNKNAIPFDPEKPMVTSGVRLGSPAATTRGFGEAEFREVGALIGEVLDGLAAAHDPAGNAAIEAAVKAKVLALCQRFPVY